MYFFRNILVITSCWLASPGAAQDSTGGCFESLIPDLILGNYEVETSPLKMFIGGSVMYFEDWATGSASLVHDDLLNYTLSEMADPIPEFHLFEDDALEPEWYWEADPRLTAAASPQTGISSADIELLYGCRIEDFPRLTGRFETQSQEGYTLNHTMRLIMLDEGFLFGQWHWVSNPPQGTVTAVRSITLIREDPSEE